MPFAEIVEALRIAAELLVRSENLLTCSAAVAMETRRGSTPEPLAACLDNPEIAFSELLAEEDAPDLPGPRTAEVCAPPLNQLARYPQLSTARVLESKDRMNSDSTALISPEGKVCRIGASTMIGRVSNTPSNNHARFRPSK